MVKRPFWQKRIEDSWQRKSIVWLTGVRRVGKTTLCQSLKDVEYFDCELPRVRRLMEDAETFLEDKKGKRIVLDEIHRLSNPTELLKIAADHYPEVKIVATGSSTLQASSKFRDTLTGRKEEIWLTPTNMADLKEFGNKLKHRLHRGGLPPFFLSDEYPERDFQEWIDSFWAKDVQELFRLEKRASFQKFLELLFVNSGGIFEATTYTGPCEISRGTVTNYLHVLEATRTAQIISPFTTRKSTEIVAAPKVYTFDTGFISYYKGWFELRPEDCGVLWEHFVLNELNTFLEHNSFIHYWRDKQKHELDFIITKRGKAPIALECKWRADSADMGIFRIFRSHYPAGENWVVASDVDQPYRRKMDHLTIHFFNADHLKRILNL